MQKPIENENPTILNVSQLPSRAQKRSTARVGSDSKYDAIVLSSPYWSNASSDDGHETREEAADDALDEQEIYGEHTPTPCQPTRPSLSLAGLCRYRTRGSVIFASSILRELVFHSSHLVYFVEGYFYRSQEDHTSDVSQTSSPPYRTLSIPIPWGS